MKKLLKNKDNLIIGVCFLIQIIFILLLAIFENELFYSGVVTDLFYLVGVSFLGIILDIYVLKICLGRRKIFFKFLIVIFIMIGVVNVSYIGKCIKAFRYDNNSELVLLTERYSLKEAKEIKKKIDKVFEYDFEGVSSRDVYIGNFYEDEDTFVLYLDDLYGNYRLKFYLEINDDKIESIFWEKDDYKFYLVKDGEKTDNFEYYYAMNIFNSVRDVDVLGLATIEEDVEGIIKDDFSKEDTANIIFTYDELIYNINDNSFYVDVFTHNMNYYGDGEDFCYRIEFRRLDKKNNKKVWYYGDSSFDFVNWDVNKK